MLEYVVKVHIKCIIYRPVGYVAKLQGSRSGSVMDVRWDNARRSKKLHKHRVWLSWVLPPKQSDVLNSLMVREREEVGLPPSEEVDW